jgi:peptide/nickel transport system substrate-binding protein
MGSLRSPSALIHNNRSNQGLVVLLFCFAFLSACQYQPATPVVPVAELPIVVQTNTPTPESTETAPQPISEISLPRQLSICLGKEPKSLFLYEAVSSAAKSVLAAIYDGPFDREGSQVQPVILLKLPTLKDGDILFEPVTVKEGETIVDALGNLNTLAEGVAYRPSGCFEQNCVQSYTGEQPVQLDEWVIRFRLKPGVSWSNGEPLKADDSVYSYEVASALYPAALPALIQRTKSYRALDDVTVEWRGVAGYLDGDIISKFLSPLPRHAWGMLTAKELGTAEISARRPLGWGAYQIAEWVGGDHITLEKNPYYFRADEGLPAFDILTFRFVASGSEAVEALLAGECDLVEPSAVQDVPLSQLVELQGQGKLSVIRQPDTAWEQILFGISPLDEQQPRFFASKDVRQAVALCIDRQALVEKLFAGQKDVAWAYVPAANPLYNPQAAQNTYDPLKAQELLQKAGWVDLDGNPQTLRTSQGVAGLPDGVPLQVDYLVSPDEERQAVARFVQAALAECGIGVNILSQEARQYLAAGSEGAVFGRRFQMAQFAWQAAWEPPCYLYLSDEIPGAYPDYPKGWGGVNASGYVNPEYDRLCQEARFTLPEMEVHTTAHQQAQAILAEDVPTLPLFWHSRYILTRMDFCGVSVDASTQDALWNIESFDYGEGCW